MDLLNTYSYGGFVMENPERVTRRTLGFKRMPGCHHVGGHLQQITDDAQGDNNDGYYVGETSCMGHARKD